MSMEAPAVATTLVEQLAELLVGPSGVDVSCLTLSEANRLADGCDDLAERLRMHIDLLHLRAQEPSLLTLPPDIVRLRRPKK